MAGVNMVSSRPALQARDEILTARDEVLPVAANSPHVAVSYVEPVDPVHGLVWADTGPDDGTLRLKVFYEDGWHEYPAYVFTEDGWQSFTPRNVSGIKRIWPRSQTPPPPGTHYAWLGDPHASVSVRLDNDGNETARNLAPNPSFEESSYNMMVLGNGIDRTIRTGHYPVHGEWEMGAYIQDASGSNATIYQDVPDVKAGQWVAFKAHVQSSEGDKTFRLRLPGFYESGTQWHSSPIVDVPRWFSESGHLFVTQAEDDADFRAYLQFHGPNGSGAPTDGWVRTDAWHVAVADTRQEAVAQVEHYFDGSTESDRAHDIWYNTDGVPHEWGNGQCWTPIH